MKNKSHKTFTFFVVNNSTDAPYKFVIKASWLWMAGTGLGLFFLFFMAAGTDYVSLLLQKNQSHWLRTENSFLKDQLHEVEGKLSALEQSLERVESLSKKLRQITRVDAGDRDVALTVPTNPDTDKSKSQWTSGIGPISVSDQKFISQMADANTVAVAVKSPYSTISVRMERALANVQNKEQDILSLWKDLSDKNDLLVKTPTIRPVLGSLTSNFGLRASPFSGDQSQHEGLDIAADIGTPIRAPADGVVSFASADEGYGQLIKIDHGHAISTRYGHCSQIYVKVGQNVRRGDIIGAVGNTGRSTGPHLHYEVRLNGAAVNPEKYILE